MADDITTALERVSLEPLPLQEGNSQSGPVVRRSGPSQQPWLWVPSSSSLSIPRGYYCSLGVENTTEPPPFYPVAYGYVPRSFPLVLFSRGVRATSLATPQIRGRSLLDLPLEVRYRIYDLLIGTHRILSLHHESIPDRRIGIMEPLGQTNRHFRAEIRAWAAGRPHLVRNPMWGLFNPFQSQVCVRYRTDLGYATYIFIGMPLTPEKVDKIAMWWRCMRKARTDYYRLVNMQVDSEVVFNGDGFVEYASDAEFEATLEWYMMKPYGDYNRMPIELPL